MASLYHVTYAKNLPSIARQGLRPSAPASLGGYAPKEHVRNAVFLTVPGGLWFWYGDALETAITDDHEGDTRFAPVVLRVPHVDCPEDVFGTEEAGVPAYRCLAEISPNIIEVFDGERWIPLKQYQKINLATSLPSGHEAIERDSFPLFPSDLRQPNPQINTDLVRKLKLSHAQKVMLRDIRDRVFSGAHLPVQKATLRSLRRRELVFMDYDPRFPVGALRVYSLTQSGKDALAKHLAKLEAAQRKPNPGTPPAPATDLAGKTVLWHISNARFRKFDLGKSAMGGIFWFAKDKDSLVDTRHGAGIRPDKPVYLYKVLANVSNSAGWDEYDKYSLGQLHDMGYDSIDLDDDFVVLDPKDIEILEVTQISKARVGNPSTNTDLVRKLKF